MGSLNGTLLNSQAIHQQDSESRHWGHPTELANGDIVTLGTSTKILVSQSAFTSRYNYTSVFGLRLTISDELIFILLLWVTLGEEYIFMVRLGL